MSELPDAPPADDGLRVVAERSIEFQRLIPRLVQPGPTDTWQADMLHYFLYEVGPGLSGQPSHALFVTSWDHDDPVSVAMLAPEASASPAK